MQPCFHLSYALCHRSCRAQIWPEPKCGPIPRCSWPVRTWMAGSKVQQSVATSFPYPNESLQDLGSKLQPCFHFSYQPCHSRCMAQIWPEPKCGPIPRHSWQVRTWMASSTVPQECCHIAECHGSVATSFQDPNEFCELWVANHSLDYTSATRFATVAAGLRSSGLNQNVDPFQGAHGQ